jgi:hypothetical protein
MKAIARRLCRLENRFEAADGKPRHYQRMVVIRLDRMPGLEGATCLRTLLPDGTVSESVVLGRSRTGHELTETELDVWVASFPIEVADGRIRVRRLPPPASTASLPNDEILVDVCYVE